MATNGANIIWNLSKTIIFDLVGFDGQRKVDIATPNAEIFYYAHTWENARVNYYFWVPIDCSGFVDLGVTFESKKDYWDEKIMSIEIPVDASGRIVVTKFTAQQKNVIMDAVERAFREGGLG